MGEMAEYYRELEEASWPQLEWLEKQYTHSWQTKDGRWIEYTKMETSHIQNTIALLNRTGFSNHPAMLHLNNELKRREAK